jgi:AcrR family transcriptional regulator
VTADDPNDNQSRILDAAATEFMNAGFDATSIDDIARRIGQTKGLIYYHFRSTVDIFYAVYERGMRQGSAEVVPGCRVQDDAEPGLARDHPLTEIGSGAAPTITIRPRGARPATSGDIDEPLAAVAMIAAAPPSLRSAAPECGRCQGCRRGTAGG